jgi:8-oxo-dGTP pyrophosphatase MutT (NUDIX family)
MPGAMVVVQDADGRILVTRRGDNGQWCLPAGAAEAGGSFARTAVAEVAEEVGLEVATADLVPFGSLSAAETHTIHYAGGDTTHCFALLFLVRRWKGDPAPDGKEAIEARFVELEGLPEPVMAPTRSALDLFGRYLASDRFQLG